MTRQPQALSVRRARVTLANVWKWILTHTAKAGSWGYKESPMGRRHPHAQSVGDVWSHQTPSHGGWPYSAAEARIAQVWRRRTRAVAICLMHALIKTTRRHLVNSGNSYFALTVDPGVHHLCASWQVALGNTKKDVECDILYHRAGPRLALYARAGVHRDLGCVCRNRCGCPPSTFASSKTNPLSHSASDSAVAIPYEPRGVESRSLPAAACQD